MSLSRFNWWNRTLGWILFIIAFTVYALTVEPTVSFWDAGEYIATSAKLQVAHPPGAPLLQMIGAFFALFAADRTQIALMVNYVSVVSSAFTILFLFWSTTHLLRQLADRLGSTTNEKHFAILGSAVIGTLAFTFSDSFWFNATETEVYATASLIMALLLWLGLKWTDALHEARGTRWLLLISFIVGLTFGVQFMGFLAIPSVVLLYYFKSYRITVKRFVLANIVAVSVLMLVFKFALTYVLQWFGWCEVFLVNSFGMPYNSGSVLMGLILAAVFYVGLRYTRKRKYLIAHNGLLCMLFLVLGFSSWLLLPIRASAKTVINENDPSDARSLLAYYNREQYPATDSPFYGSYYSDAFASDYPDKDDRPKYERNEELGTYVIVNKYKGALRGSSERHKGWLPRMWSEQHIENYMRYYGVLEFQVKPGFKNNQELRNAAEMVRRNYASGAMGVSEYIAFLNEANDYIEVHPPTLAQNLRYMLHFQFGYMYWRYFMWNFTGKQNDEQGRFDANGAWLSGISVLDGLRLGSQKGLPDEVLENKGRNTYYFLPLLLGLLGLVFQFRYDWKRFWVLLVFFLFTGLAIQFYTNPPIFQPRERDYSLVGSFYVFSIWIGFGAFALTELFRKKMRSVRSTAIVLLVCLAGVPILMASQNWDDHDRSDRFTALAMAKAYLDSTKKDSGSILFTIGDIDTFPLWYVQDIEGYRTDTRVVVTTYFGTDWFIDQMKRQAYESKPIPSQLDHDRYRYGSRDVIYHAPLTDSRWHIKDFMKWVASDAPRTKVRSLLQEQDRDLSGYSDSYLDAVYYPTNKIRLPVNKQKVLETGLVRAEDADQIVDFIDIDLPQSGIGKASLMMLDIVANNDWERPIYFSGGSFDEKEYIWMSEYLQLDGLVYKLVPIKTETESIFDKGRIDSELMYDIVDSWDWGNSGSAHIYHDPQTRKQWGVSFRVALARLLETLLEENNMEKARKIISLSQKHIPIEHYGYYTFAEPFLEGSFKTGQTDMAWHIYAFLKKVYCERLDYYRELSVDQQYERIEELLADLQSYRRLIDVLVSNGQYTQVEMEENQFKNYLKEFKYLLEEG